MLRPLELEIINTQASDLLPRNHKVKGMWRTAMECAGVIWFSTPRSSIHAMYASRMFKMGTHGAELTLSTVNATDLVQTQHCTDWAIGSIDQSTHDKSLRSDLISHKWQKVCGASLGTRMRVSLNAAYFWDVNLCRQSCWLIRLTFDVADISRSTDALGMVPCDAWDVRVIRTFFRWPSTNFFSL